MTTDIAKCTDFHYTPVEVCEDLLENVIFNEGEETLEPCIGRNKNFYNLIPEPKEWGEIELGRDIFTYDYGRKFSKVIVNPPYKSNDEDPKERKNIAYKFIIRCLELCSDECWCLLNNAMLNSLTPIRLKDIVENHKFGIVYMRVININKWYGRYYWICLKKNANNILNY